MTDINKGMPTDSNLDSTEFERLERLMDKYGIGEVLISLSELCGRKAEHVAVNWQDAHLAKRWATLEGAIGVIVPKAGGL
jgi:hypothetical protein